MVLKFNPRGRGINGDGSPGVFTQKTSPALGGPGGGLSGQIEYHASRFFKEVTDPSMVLGMALGVSAFNAARAALLPSLLRSSSRFLSQMPLATRLTASSIALIPEVGTFWGTSKAIHGLLRPGSNVWDLKSNAREILGLGMTLGFLKSFGFAFGKLAVLAKQRLGDLLPQHPMFWQQTGMLAGIMAGHGAEISLGWRSPTDFNGFLTGSLITLGHFNMGGLLSHQMFSGIYRLNGRIQQQMAAREQAQFQRLQLPTLWRDGPAWARQAAGSRRTGGRDLIHLTQRAQMASSRDRGDEGSLGFSQAQDTAGTPPKTIWRPVHRRYQNGYWREWEFKRKEWEGVVERLEEIEGLITKYLKEVRSGEVQTVWNGSPRKTLIHLVESRGDYPRGHFKFILEVLSLLLEKHGIFTMSAAESTRAYLLLNKLKGIDPRSAATFDPFFSSLVQQFGLTPRAKPRQILAKRNTFNQRLVSQILTVSEERIPQAEKIKWYDRLRELLNDPNPNPPAKRLEALGETFHSETGLRKIFTKGKRPVMWDPFGPQGRENLILHPSLGEGTIIGEEGEGRFQVLFADRGEPVTVMESFVVRPVDRARYDAVLRQRLTRFGHLPYYYLPLAIRSYLSRSESEVLGEVLHDRYDVDLDGRPSETNRSLTWANILRLRTRGSAKKLDPRLDAEIRKFSQGMAEKLGIDPLAFLLSLMMGESANRLSVLNSSQWRSGEGRERDRIMTPDLVRGFLQYRPWMEAWRKAGVWDRSPVTSLSHYFPTYYRGDSRPRDGTELYFRFREGEEGAFRKVTELFRKPVEDWAQDHARRAQRTGRKAVLVPMIGTAPLTKLARQFGPPVRFPWRPRPDNYGAGVEGQRAMVKMAMVEQALRLDPDRVEALRGKAVLLLDDNLTDGITYMQARKLLLDAGAKEVNLLVLTKTIRRPEELEWEPRKF